MHGLTPYVKNNYYNKLDNVSKQKQFFEIFISLFKTYYFSKRIIVFSVQRFLEKEIYFCDSIASCSGKKCFFT